MSDRHCERASLAMAETSAHLAGKHQLLLLADDRLREVARFEAEMEDALRLVEDLVEQAHQPQVSRELGQRQAKGAVGREKGDMAAQRLRLQHLLRRQLDVFEPALGEVGRSHPEHFRLDQAADVENLVDVAQAERCDDIAAPGLALDQPFLRQPGERRADRRLPDLVAVADLLFGQAFAGAQHAGDDVALQLLIGLLAAQYIGGRRRRRRTSGYGFRGDHVRSSWAMQLTLVAAFVSLSISVVWYLSFLRGITDNVSCRQTRLSTP